MRSKEEKKFIKKKIIKMFCVAAQVSLKLKVIQQ